MSASGLSDSSTSAASRSKPLLLLLPLLRLLLLSGGGGGGVGAECEARARGSAARPRSSARARAQVGVRGGKEHGQEHLAEELIGALGDAAVRSSSGRVGAAGSYLLSSCCCRSASRKRICALFLLGRRGLGNLSASDRLVAAAAPSTCPGRPAARARRPALLLQEGLGGRGSTEGRVLLSLASPPAPRLGLLGLGLLVLGRATAGHGLQQAVEQDTASMAASGGGEGRTRPAASFPIVHVHGRPASSAPRHVPLEGRVTAAPARSAPRRRWARRRSRWRTSPPRSGPEQRATASARPSASARRRNKPCPSEAVPMRSRVRGRDGVRGSSGPFRPACRAGEPPGRRRVGRRLQVVGQRLISAASTVAVAQDGPR